MDNSGLGHLWEKIKGLVGSKADVGHSHVSADITDKDTAPTSGSARLVTSGGVYTALSGKQAKVTGGASTITVRDLVENRALMSNLEGKVIVSAVTSTELGYLGGVTSNVQTQLNGKAEKSHTHTKSEITDFPTSLPANGGNASTVNGHTVQSNVPQNAKFTDTVYDDSEIKTAISGKQAKVTGGASTITSSNLTASRALVSNASGKVAVSDVTSTELGYLDGVTSNVQTQLNNKAPKSHASTATTYGIGTSSNYGHVKLSDSTTSTSGTSSGIAATPAAVKAAYDLANTANTKANIAKNSASTTGDRIYGHLTVGGRNYSDCYGDYSLTAGYHCAAGDYSVCFGGGESVNNYNYCFATSSGVIGGINNAIGLQSGDSTKIDYSTIIGGSFNNIYSSGTETYKRQSCIINSNSGIAGQMNLVTGRYNRKPTEGELSGTTGDVFIIGIGDSSARKNGFRVDFRGNGYFYKAVSGTGADYAEMWEWQDGNPNSEDRVGYFVSFIGDKIRLAQENDDLRKIGIISGNPAVVGDNFADDWQGMYLQDIYGRNITEHKSYNAEYDEDGNLIHEAYEADEYVLNPDYNSNEEYVPRRQRKEWDAVGTHGKLVVHDDGTCQVDGFCKPANGGIATASDTGFYVMERVNENHIRVYIR